MALLLFLQPLLEETLQFLRREVVFNELAFGLDSLPQPLIQLVLQLRFEFHPVEGGMKGHVPVIEARFLLHHHRAPEAVWLSRSWARPREAFEEGQPLAEPDVHATSAQVEEQEVEHPSYACPMPRLARRARSFSCFTSTPRNGILRAIVVGSAPARASTVNQSSSSEVLGFFRIPSTRRTP